MREIAATVAPPTPISLLSLEHAGYNSAVALSHLLFLSPRHERSAKVLHAMRPSGISDHSDSRLFTVGQPDERSSLLTDNDLPR